MQQRRTLPLLTALLLFPALMATAPSARAGSSSNLDVEEDHRTLEATELSSAHAHGILATGGGTRVVLRGAPVRLADGRRAVLTMLTAPKAPAPSLVLVLFARQGPRWAVAHRLVLHRLRPIPKATGIEACIPQYASLPASVTLSDPDGDGRSELLVRHRLHGECPGVDLSPIRRTLIVDLHPAPRVTFRAEEHEIGRRTSRFRSVARLHLGRDVDGDGRPDLVLRTWERETNGGSVTTVRLEIVTFQWDAKTDRWRKGTTERRTWRETRGATNSL